MGQESSQIDGEGMEMPTDSRFKTPQVQDEVASSTQILSSEPSRKTRKKKRSDSPNTERNINSNTEDNPGDQVDGIEEYLNRRLKKVLGKKSKSKKEGRSSEEKSKSKKHKHRRSGSSENILQSIKSYSEEATEEQDAQIKAQETEVQSAPSAELENNNHVEPAAPEPLIPESTEVVPESSMPDPQIVPSSSSAELGSKKKKRKSKSKPRIAKPDFTADVYHRDNAKVTPNVDEEEQTQIANSWEPRPPNSWEAINSPRKGSPVEEAHCDDVDMAEAENRQDIIPEDQDTRTNINTIISINGHHKEDQARLDASQSQNAQPAPIAEEEIIPQIGVYLGSESSSKPRKPKRRIPIEDEVVDTPSKRARKALRAKDPTSSQKRYRAGKPPAASSSQVAHKLSRSPSKTQRNKSSTEDGAHGGKFDDTEEAIIKLQLLKYREMHDMTEEDQNSLIQGKAAPAAEMFNMVCEELPGRARWAVIKFCRRKYHNFEARGKWTADDDEDLRQAYQLWPKGWTKIAQRLKRHPEDCRDRWRNYGICGDSLKLDYWTPEEEQRLKEVIAECVSHIREMKRNNMLHFNAVDLARYAEDTPADVDLVDWLQVSEKMGHTRSRLQCITKWKRIVDRENPKIRDRDHKPLVFVESSARVVKARVETQIMHADDKLKILHDIRESEVGREGKIKWTNIGDAAFRSQWSVLACKVAFKKLKATVQDADTYKLQDLVSILIDKFENSRDRDPTEYAFQETDIPTKTKKKVLSLKKKHLSLEFVSPEDDEEEEVEDEVDETPQPEKSRAQLEDEEIMAADNSVEDEIMAEMPARKPKSKKLKRPSSSSSSVKKRKLTDRLARESQSWDEQGIPTSSNALEVPESDLENEHNGGAMNGVYDKNLDGRSPGNGMDGNGAYYEKLVVDSELDSDRDVAIPAKRPVEAY